MTLARDRRDDGDAPVRDVRLDGGGLVVSDPDNEDAWIRTDHAVPFG